MVEGTKTLPITVTRETSIGELMQIPAAQAMLAQMQQQAQADAPSTAADMDALGEGGREMAEAMMFEMPLGSLITFGVMNDEQLDGIIAMLNGQN